VVPADVAEATWEVEVTESYGGDARDFHGPAVQGTHGERFLYLTWLEGPDATMFRRAKLMLEDAPRGGVGERARAPHRRPRVATVCAAAAPGRRVGRRLTA